MYQLDAETGNTIFSLEAFPSARRVFLIGHSDQSTCRVAMHIENSCWTASLLLPAGWFIYRFEVDGRSRRDRTTNGKLKSTEGHACSLAIIPTTREKFRHILQSQATDNL